MVDLAHCGQLPIAGELVLKDAGLDLGTQIRGDLLIDRYA
jgi:hypothetical protein